MENDNGNAALNLTKSQRKRRQRALKRKLNANLGLLENSDPNTAIGIPATVDKMSMSSLAGKSLNCKGKAHRKVANGMLTDLNGEVEVQKKMGTTIGETSTGMNVTASKKRKRKKMKNSNPDFGTKEGLGMTEVLGVKCNETIYGKTATLDADMVSKERDHAKVANGKTGESETKDLSVNGKEKWKKKPDSKNKQPTLGEILNAPYLQSLETSNGEMVSGTISTDNPASKKQKRQKLKNLNLGDFLSNRESTTEGLSTTKVLEGNHGETAALDKTGGSETTNLSVSGKEKKKKKPKSMHTQPTSGEILSPQYLQNLEASKGEKGSGTASRDDPASKKQKRKKLDKNSDLGDILSTRESTHEGLSTAKVLEVKDGEMVSAKTVAPDASMVSKGVHTEVANVKMGESEITNLILNDAEKKKKRKRKAESKNKQPTFGELESNREKMLNNNRDLGDMVSTHESTQEGLSTTRVLEVKSGETVLAKAATLDANIVSNEDHAEASNGKTVESETTNLNVNDKEKKKSKRKSENKWPTSGENLDPQYVQNLETSETGLGTTSTDNTTLKKQKKQRLDRNLDLGNILSTHESTQEGLSTTKVFEVKSSEAVSGKTATSDANVVSKGDDTEVASGKIQENETNNLNVNGKEKKKKRKKPKSKSKEPTLGDNLNLQYLQNLEAAKHETGSEGTVLKHFMLPQISNTEMGSKTIVLKSAEPADLEITKAKVDTALAGKGQEIGVKEMNQVATLEKKLLILDVNGLLADVVSERPKDIVADKYITRRAIFKRPYLDDFLRFCFERFKVGIWSSRTMKNLVPVVNFLLGDLKKNLLFIWDACKCTDSGIGTLEEKHKRVVVKDLRKIWNEDGPKKSWMKGTFHESNTLLVDDSPYKALLNPKNTGIFPASYSYKDRDDNFLGPKGELQTYLEGLATADDVKTYVEQHPFGQDAIDGQSEHWAFYSNIIERFNDKNIMESLHKKNQWKRRRCCKDFYHPY